MQYHKAQIGVYDNNGNLVHSQCRRDIDKKRQLLKAVKIVLINDCNEVFLVQPRNSLWPGLWSGSCADLVRECESFRDAAHRTLLRELRVEAPLIKVSEAYHNFKGIRRIFSVFLARSSETPHICKHDILEGKWVPFHIVNKMIQSGQCSPTFSTAWKIAEQFIQNEYMSNN